MTVHSTSTAGGASAPFGAEAYAQGDQFQREKRSLFAKTWLPFCASGQVAGAGEFINHTIGGWPVVVLRGSDGMLRAFHNVCRHQNMPVVDKPAGKCDQLRCRFHGWVYDLSGALTLAPPAVAPPDTTGIKLQSAGIIEESGMVFVRLDNVSDKPPSLGLGEARFAAAATTDIGCNWKTFIEHLLDEAAWRFTWPLAFRRESNGVRIVRQVIPRTFSRTRVVDIFFADGGADISAAQADISGATGQDKSRAEALQEQRAAGALSPASPAVTEFRSRTVAAAA